MEKECFRDAYPVAGGLPPRLGRAGRPGRSVARGGPGPGRDPRGKTLPGSTLAFVKVNNAAELREAFKQSQFGQLWPTRR